MRISVAVCDDLEEERLQIVRTLQNYERRHELEFHLETFRNGEALVHAMQPGRWDIVMLDIYMPGMDGIQTARLLREQDRECILIFVTTSLEHGMVSYELQASDYLVKPIAQKDVDAALDWCLREKKERFRSITVRSEWDETEILLRNIQYIEIKRHTAYIHTTERVIQTSRGMNALEAEIDNPDFLRCHRSFLVNMRYIRRLDKRDFVMENGDLVPIGSSDAAATRQKFMDWIFLQSWKSDDPVDLF